MKKLTTLLMTLAFVLMPILGNVRLIAAQNAEKPLGSLAPQAVLLADNFESYSPSAAFPAGNWVNHNGSTAIWSIVADGGSQAARQTAAVTNIISNGNTAWTNYRISARVKFPALGLRHGVVGRFTTTSAYYSLYLRSTATGGTRVIELNKRSGGSNIALQTVSFPIVAGNSYKLTLEFDGANIKGYVNDELKVQAVDADYAAGKVGLYNTGETFYDDLSVEDSSTPPSAPTNLAATGGSSQINLSWMAASGATGYNIKRSTTSGGNYQTIASNVSGLSYIDTTVTNGTTYYYVISAVNAAGESSNSNEAGAASQLAIPGAPSALIVAAGNQEVKIYWTGSIGASGYNVKRSLSSAGTYTTIALNVAATEYTDATVTNGTTYYYKISAVNAAGESANSSAIAATPRLGQTINVANQTELTAALNNAVAGDQIILANGNYSAFKVRRKYGTAENPIIVKAQNPRGAVFNAGQLELQDTVYLTIEGFRWTLSTSIKLRGTIFNRMTKNAFEFTETGLTDLDWVTIGGIGSHHNRIDHNDFKNKITLGNFVTLSGENAQVTQYDLIDHNYFFNLGPRAANEKETIRIGDSSVSQSNGYTIVEHNLFEQCDGDPEIVSVKTNDNIVRYNTFRRSKGGLTARQGNRSLLYGNFFLGENVEGTGGIRAYGNDHKIFNNYFEGLTGTANYAPISITNGDADDAELPGADQSKHYRPQRIVIANNTLVNNVSNIEIGGSYTLAPRDITFANNLITGSTGELVKYRTAPITPVYAGNIAYPIGTATVGINATDAEFRNVNPLLTTENNLQKLSSNSPAIDASATNYAFITEDFEGQARDTLRDIGADEFGSPTSPRLPLTAANAGLNAIDNSISGRVTNAAGQGISGVTVVLTISAPPTFAGTTATEVQTDDGGYFRITDVVPNENYTLTFSKAQYAFNPSSVSITNLSSDINQTINAVSLAPTAATATISGRVLLGKSFGTKAFVDLTNQAGEIISVRADQRGFFSFENVVAGRTYVLSARTNWQQIGSQVITVNEDLQNLIIVPMP